MSGTDVLVRTAGCVTRDGYRQTDKQRGIGRAVTGAGQEALLFRLLLRLLIFGLELL